MEARIEADDATLGETSVLRPIFGDTTDHHAYRALAGFIRPQPPTCTGTPSTVAGSLPFAG